MTRPTWRQLTIAFPNPHDAQDAATRHLAPILIDAETRQLITAWFVVRKGHWRLRYLPTEPSEADPYVHDRLSRLHQAGHLTTTIIPGTYEPETHAFGGIPAMQAAHTLWHHDSRHLLTPTTAGEPVRHRELSIILCAALMRSAGLDWYEQGDVWARVAEHRDPPDPALTNSLQAPTQRLLTLDPASLTHADAPLAAARTWIDAYTSAGTTLGQLHHGGQLHRGLRAILAHHVIFAWNRRSIPGQHQAALAAAKTTILGPDPTTAPLTQTASAP